MKIDLDLDLASRLATVARQLKRDPAECARSAIAAFVTDCEEAQALRARFGGGEYWVRDEDFMD
jgi:predicted transcriptional regulator